MTLSPLRRCAALSVLAAAASAQAAPTVVYDTDLPTVSGAFGAGTATTTSTPGVGTTTTVTGPGGGANRASAAFVFDQWQQRNVGGGGTVGITTTYANAGNGSAYFAGSSGDSKADLEFYFSSALTLSSITGLAYDWYRDSSSTDNAGLNQHPVLRLYVDADGSAATTGDRGYLVYEQAYNLANAYVEDQWVDAAITGSTVLWSTGGLPNAFSNYTTALSQWQTLLGSASVLGLSIGTGSGWAGSFVGAVDNVTLQRGTQPELAWNFEVAAGSVPEPGSLALVALALGGLAAAARRRS